MKPDRIDPLYCLFLKSSGSTETVSLVFLVPYQRAFHSFQRDPNPLFRPDLNAEAPDSNALFSPIELTTTTGAVVVSNQ